MNIFYLDRDPVKAAQMSCDKHVVKMILETVQMLFSAWLLKENETGSVQWDKSFFKNESDFKKYKLTHVNHPTSVWIRSKKRHYLFACELAIEIANEYRKRYNKEHKCEKYARMLKKMGFPGKRGINKMPPMHKVGLISRRLKNNPFKLRYIHCAISDDVWDKCVVKTKKGYVNALPTYRRYYALKQYTIKRPMKWYKGTVDPPEWFDMNRTAKSCKRKRIKQNHLVQDSKKIPTKDVPTIIIVD